MKDILVNNGWKFSRSCNCGGEYQEVYIKEGFTKEVSVKTNSGRFAIKEHGGILCKGGAVELEEKMKKFGLL